MGRLEGAKVTDGLSVGTARALQIAAWTVFWGHKKNAPDTRATKTKKILGQALPIGESIF